MVGQGRRERSRVPASERWRQVEDKIEEKHGRRIVKARRENESKGRMKKKIMQNGCLLFAEMY